MAVAPIVAPAAPTRIACLQCQLLGHRKLTCSKADQCRDLPHSFFIGPLLIAGWAATVLFFILAVR